MFLSRNIHIIQCTFSIMAGHVSVYTQLVNAKTVSPSCFVFMFFEDITLESVIINIYIYFNPLFLKL